VTTANATLFSTDNGSTQFVCNARAFSRFALPASEVEIAVGQRLLGSRGLAAGKVAYTMVMLPAYILVLAV